MQAVGKSQRCYISYALQRIHNPTEAISTKKLRVYCRPAVTTCAKLRTEICMDYAHSGRIFDYLIDFCMGRTTVVLPTLAARRCLPPGANVCVAAPANHITSAIRVFFQDFEGMGCEPTDKVDSSSAPFHSLSRLPPFYTQPLPFPYK